MKTTFPKDRSLAGLQKYMQDICEERGWDTASDLETFLLFSEEVGELAKAIRNRRQLFIEKEKISKGNVQEELAMEFADVLGYLLDLASRMEVDLEAAFERKEAINAARSWGGN